MSNRDFRTRQGFKVRHIAQTETAIFGQYFVPDDQVAEGGVWFDAMWDTSTGKIERCNLHDDYSLANYT